MVAVGRRLYNYMGGIGSATIKNAAHSKHQEEEETTQNGNHLISDKAPYSSTEVIDSLQLTYK